MQRARIEKYRHTDLSAARDSYLELQRVCKTLLEILSETQLILQELEAYPLSTAAGKLRNGLSGFDLMGTGYIKIAELLISRCMKHCAILHLLSQQVRKPALPLSAD